jgi:hypothetical protein
MIRVHLLNAGGATALDVGARIAVGSQFSLLSPASLDLGTLPTGGELTVDVRVVAAQQATGVVEFMATDRSGQVLIRLVPISARYMSLGEVHLPLLSRSSPIPGGTMPAP